MFKKYFKYLKHVFVRYIQKIELMKYDGGTIAEYFRKQGAQIGEGCWLEIKALSAEPFLIRIGNHVSVAQRVQLLTHDAAVDLFRKEIPSLQRFGKIEIKDNCFIGAGATIMPNVTIGPNAIVAGRALVTKDVPPNAIVGGNPARQIGTIDEYKQKVIQNWKEQKPPGYLKEIEDGKYYGKGFSLVGLKERDLPILRAHLTKLFWGEER